MQRALHVPRRPGILTSEYPLYATDCCQPRRDPVSSFSASIDLPPVPSTVSLARRLVRDVLRTWAAPQDREDAELLVTELVANVVDHAGGDVLTLELVLAGAWLRIAVVDGS